MANPSEMAADAFTNNALLVRALMLLKPPNDRERIVRWVDHLSTAAASAEEQASKNEYLWYLLMNVQYKDVLAPPFDQYPRPGPIAPLSSVLGDKAYEKVKKGSKTEIFFHDTLRDIYKKKLNRDQRHRSDEEFAYLDLVDQKTSSVPNETGDESHPSEFFDNQPKPNDGCFCYAAVFGDYSDELS